MLQDANERFQEQAQRASDEKERVQRDYLQVVVDLGKAQSQLNAMSRDASASAANEQLQHENDVLLQQIKALEVRWRFLWLALASRASCVSLTTLCWFVLPEAAKRWRRT